MCSLGAVDAELGCGVRECAAQVRQRGLQCTNGKLAPKVAPHVAEDASRRFDQDWKLAMASDWRVSGKYAIIVDATCMASSAEP